VIGSALAPLARAWNSLYLGRMARPVSTPNAILPATPPKARAASIIVWSAATFGSLIVAAAAALWIYYGTTVFFEMIAAGIAACF
jgi:hypothetical protein